MIETRDVRVDYDGVTAVRDLNLTIPEGEVYGLIGPNGAGKTSTIRVLATLQHPTYGEVFVGGIDLAQHPSRAHRILGYMPDNPPAYEHLRCWEFLDLFASAYFVGRRERRRKIDELLDQTDLAGKRNTMAGTLSTGMRQRLVLAKTLLHDPQVLLLDEPASGLDPHARIELREMLIRQAELGKTILVSSHILTELSAFCGSIGIMQKGVLVASGKIDAIVNDMNRTKRMVISIMGDADGLIERLEEIDDIENVAFDRRQVRFAFRGSDADAVELLRTLVTEGFAIASFHEHRMGVEDIFMQVGAREVS